MSIQSEIDRMVAKSATGPAATYPSSKGGMQFNTADGPGTVHAPLGGAPTSAVAGDEWRDPGIDTAAEARRMQDKLAAYDRELADPATPDTKKAIIAKMKANLERAIPFQLAQFAEIDKQRARSAEINARGTPHKGSR